MLKENKYRAWDKIRKKYVYDGDKWKPPGYRGETKEIKITNAGILYWQIAQEDGFVRVVDEDGHIEDYYSTWDCLSIYNSELEIEQYIGYKDKNNKELFDNDIIEITLDYRNDYSKSNWLIFYDNECCCYAIKQPHKKDCMNRTEYVEKLDWYLEEKYEIEWKGTFHENPELLKVDENGIK